MKRPQEEEQIPPPSGECPIMDLPGDVILHMILIGRFTIKDVIRWCSTNTRMRRICQDEYVWKKLYFQKVVKDPILIKGAEGVDVKRYIDEVLMKTPFGAQWKAQTPFASNFLVLLVAFVYRATFINGDKYGNRLDISIQEDTIKHFNIPDMAYSTHISTHNGHSINIYILDVDWVLWFICKLLESNDDRFNLQRYFHNKVPSAFTESPLVCSNCASPNVNLTCGTCRLVAYCSEKCGVEHFEKSHYIDCMYHMRDKWSIIETNEEAKKYMFDTGDMSGYAISIEPNGELKREIHPDATQFFLVVRGEGESVIDGKQDAIKTHSMFYIPRGKAHSVKAGEQGLKLLTLYAPATHHTE